MSKAKIKDNQVNNDTATTDTPSINSIAWTDYVLSLLVDDEKIKGNPTTDGLRRIFETALNCVLTDSSSHVVQSPSPENEKRATVVHSLTFILNKEGGDGNHLNIRSVSGAADVYWGNCDKIYRNHPVAVAETRAEGRALRRALRLRKVVAAEELAENIEDDPDGNSVLNISSNQINFMDVMAKRIDVDVIKLIESLNIDTSKIKSISHENAVLIIKKLTEHQQNIQEIPENLIGYQPLWKENI